MQFALNKMETNQKKLPSQPKINLRENASAMTLRNGKQVQTTTPNLVVTKENKKEEKPAILDVPTKEVSS